MKVVKMKVIWVEKSDSAVWGAAGAPSGVQHRDSNKAIR